MTDQRVGASLSGKQLSGERSRGRRPNGRRNVSIRKRLALGSLTVVAAVACRQSRIETKPSAEPIAQTASQPAPSAPHSAKAPKPSGTPPSQMAAPYAPDKKRYAWLRGDYKMPPATGSLSARLRPPAGFKRVDVTDNPFGAWLRDLPLAAPGTPVRSFRGTVIHPGDHPNIAAVVAIDIGIADLQQCADAVMRMRAEWQWSAGDQQISFNAASGQKLPFSRWQRGERIAQVGRGIQWKPTGLPVKSDDHRSFRKYLNAVFAWSNTVALSRQAKSQDVAAVKPGDFIIEPGNPGHAVLFLDLAEKDGERVALLGQSFMPAQSFQVLRPSGPSAWFKIDASQPLKTPFWRAFPWKYLRTLDKTTG